MHSRHSDQRCWAQRKGAGEGRGGTNSREVLRKARSDEKQMRQLLSRTPAPRRDEEKPLPWPPRKVNEKFTEEGHNHANVLGHRSGIPKTRIPWQTHHPSGRGEKHPKSQLLISPACMMSYGFHANFLRTAMNRRSKIIKGPYQLEVFPSTSYVRLLSS